MRALCIGVLGSLTFSVVSGCSEEPRPVAEEPTPANESSAAAEAESRVELSDAEIQSLAEKQKVCAVTGEPLGSMGTPVPVRVADSAGTQHTVLLCCESCREELLSDPDKYLDKLAVEEPDSIPP